MLKRDLQHSVKNTFKRRFHRAVQLIKLGVNLDMKGIIVGCKIVCNISRRKNKKQFSFGLILDP